jgi:A/G-specific adenine glycosylase
MQRALGRCTAKAMSEAGEIEEFRANLLAWYGEQRRDLPWRRTRDPYAIWISEIMLQQTRVAAAIPYYECFLTRFPDWAALADAPEQDVLAHWAGLGYYYRARNLQRAARRMREHGAFPSSYEAIRELPGVGDYTAAAIASIAFGLPHAVVDGNVLRVLSRVCDDFTDIASASGRKHFARIADELVERAQPGEFNQAVMELGATVCLPKDPQCLLCPAARLCGARANGHQNELPVKITAQKSVEEHRTVFWIEQDGALLLWQRPADARLMPGFWELPECEQLKDVEERRRLGSFRHTITFHHYRFDVVEARAPLELGACEWVRITDLTTLPVSTILKKARGVVGVH